jgi:ectoine hydroxylase-related dioxygenase (phytanoyl-CoA dioxygenase family)
MPAVIRHVDANTDPNSIVAILQEDGAVIVEGLIGSATLARLNEELTPDLEAARPDRAFLNPALEWFFGKQTRHLTAVSSRSRTFASEVLCHPTFLAICDEVLAPSCASYQLNLAHVLDRGPGAEAQLLHRDELVWVHFPKPHPELQVASMIALSDFTRDNGATLIVPGSHRWEASRTPEEDEIAHAEMKAGSAAIYLGSTIHAGGSNSTSDEWRRGMHVSYVLGWLRTEENHYLGTPLEVARTLPRRAQELLGYASHDALASGGGYLGAVDLRNPVDLIEAGEL